MLVYNEIDKIKKATGKDRAMRIAICDDEKEICNWIKEQIQEICVDAEISIFYSGESLLENSILADILFLDISMEGRNGIEIARKIREEGKKTIIIFITALKEYVFQAFDVGAFHYLVKPFSKEKLKSVFQSAETQYKERTIQQENKEKYFFIRKGGERKKVKLADIVYAEVFNRKIVIHTIEGETEYYGKMSELEKQAGEDFFRVHRAYLVHMKYILQYNATMIYLENGEKALLAKQRYPEFVKQFLKYNQRR